MPFPCLLIILALQYSQLAARSSLAHPRSLWPCWTLILALASASCFPRLALPFVLFCLLHLAWLLQLATQRRPPPFSFSLLVLITILLFPLLSRLQLLVSPVSHPSTHQLVLRPPRLGRQALLQVDTISVHHHQQHQLGLLTPDHAKTHSHTHKHTRARFCESAWLPADIFSKPLPVTSGFVVVASLVGLLPFARRPVTRSTFDASSSHGSALILQRPSTFSHTTAPSSIALPSLLANTTHRIRPTL